MNLIVSTRIGVRHLRLDVEGKWRYGDALVLAYLVKAGALKAERQDVVVDLLRLVTPPGVYGKFLLCDRLRRALPATVSVALIAAPDLLDAECASGTGTGTGTGTDTIALARVGCFTSETEALLWLYRKNPSDLRAEG